MQFNDWQIAVRTSEGKSITIVYFHFFLNKKLFPIRKEQIIIHFMGKYESAQNGIKLCTAQKVKMKVANGLTSVFSHIGDNSESFFKF